MDNVHRLGWHEGQTRYCQACTQYYLSVIMGKPEAIYYVMGEQKFNFLREEFPKLSFVLYNITMSTLPPLTCNIHCIYRDHGEHCALIKCYRMYLHYTNYT